jgi:hypothetical protein
MSGISSQQKEGSLKKREKEKNGEQGLESKRGETTYKEAPRFKKKREDEIYKLLGEILSKERRSHFLIVHNPMCGQIHTYTSFAFALPSMP